LKVGFGSRVCEKSANSGGPVSANAFVALRDPGYPQWVGTCRRRVDLRDPKADLRFRVRESGHPWPLLSANCGSPYLQNGPRKADL